MAMTITVKYEGSKCKECGKILPVGSSARWYRRGVIYGIGCHADTRKSKSPNQFQPVQPVPLVAIAQQMTQGMTDDDAQAFMDGFRGWHDEPDSACDEAAYRIVPSGAVRMV